VNLQLPSLPLIMALTLPLPFPSSPNSCIPLERKGNSFNEFYSSDSGNKIQTTVCVFFKLFAGG